MYLIANKIGYSKEVFSCMGLFIEPKKAFQVRYFAFHSNMQKVSIYKLLLIKSL